MTHAIERAGCTARDGVHTSNVGGVLVNFPLRVIFALVIIGAIAGVAVWGVIAVLQAKRLTQSQRMIGVGAIVLVMALLAAWVVFFWPAYWD
jgi:hypothetical protein